MLIGSLDQPYRISELLDGGELKFGRSSKAFGQGTSRALSCVIRNNTPSIFNSINEMAWKSKNPTHIYGPVVSLTIKYRCLSVSSLVFQSNPHP